MISVVMASYLGVYKNAASNREVKIIRAIQSVLDQTIPVECVVIADGCQKTVEIIKRHFPDKVSGFLIPKQHIWYGMVRNTGIKQAQNDIICYLDVDDYLEKTHCEFISNNFANNDWVWFNDIVYSRGQWKTRHCDVNKKGLCGTSNVAHRKIALWPEKASYAHDWQFILNLKDASTKFKFIGNGGYKVGHIPGRYDV